MAVLDEQQSRYSAQTKHDQMDQIRIVPSVTDHLRKRLAALDVAGEVGQADQHDRNEQDVRSESHGRYSQFRCMSVQLRWSRAVSIRNALARCNTALTRTSDRAAVEGRCLQLVGSMWVTFTAGDRIRTDDVQLGKSNVSAQALVAEGVIAVFQAKNEVYRWLTGR